MLQLLYIYESNTISSNEGKKKEVIESFFFPIVSTTLVLEVETAAIKQQKKNIITCFSLIFLCSLIITVFKKKTG